jgi:hypothetical protein
VKEVLVLRLKVVKATPNSRKDLLEEALRDLPSTETTREK